jgi:hypothetical protein
MDAAKKNAPGDAGQGRETKRTGETPEAVAHGGNDAAGTPTGTPSFDDAQALADAGYELIPLRPSGKEPRDTRWIERPYAAAEVIAEARACGGNIGVRLRPCDLVIDVDPRNGGDKSLPLLVSEVGLNLDACPRVRTGGGGDHFYLHKPADLLTRGKLPHFPGIDFKTQGGQVVAPGSIHPATGRMYEAEFFLAAPHETPEAPSSLLRLLRAEPSELPTGESGGDRWGEISAAQLTKALEGIPPDDFGQGTYDEWFRLMCACHHATAGAGCEEFVTWSTQAAGYEDHDSKIRERWESLKESARSGRPTTIRQLYQVLTRYGKTIPNPPPEHEFEAVSVDSAELLPSALRGLTSEWVWVADAMVFIRKIDLKRYTAEQWRTLHAHLSETPILQLVWKNANFIQKFESLTYRPSAPQVIEGERGKIFNIWRPSGLKPEPGDVSWFLEHMMYLIPEEREREAVLDYLAHLVQRPQVKIHFALLIRGEQGTGKSAIGELMLRIIGKGNVRKPSNDEVIGRWTSWQEGAQLAILEELMTVGRLDVVNRLKPLITEPSLRIEEKYQCTYSIDNYLNLLCFTNHKDAVKIERGDRRWFIVFSPAKPLGRDYYANLFRGISGEGAAHVAHWLMTRDLTRFDAKGHAPATSAKEQMRELTMGEAEAILMELYVDRAPPFEFDLLSLSDLEQALPDRVQRATKNLGAVSRKFLEDVVGAVQHKRNTNTGVNVGAMRLWSIRNHDEWAAAGPTARASARAAYWLEAHNIEVIAGFRDEVKRGREGKE